ncbi:MAG: chemotaxis protein CheC [Ruminiclostridium sp.]|nr:chemotaxis protein CheC [Ruminiclostridium sp.]MBR4111539.1 chemotaxis protein CheC [Ruminiclostridium sp.]
MAIKNFEDLGAMEIDVLTEVGNIGAGNAMTALSSMIGQMVDIEVPAVNILGFQEAIDYAGGPEKTVVGIIVPIKDDIEGEILFLLENDIVELVVSTFFGTSDIDLLNLSPDMTSALTELGNIMAASYVNAIAELTGMKIEVEIPMLSIDMLGAIMSVPAAQMGELSDKLLYIDNLMLIDKVSVKSKMMLLPTVESLDKLLRSLGVIA